MKLSEAVKPISHFKSHASEVVRDIIATHRPVVITLNGEAKAIIQDIREYEKDRESLALLKILALSRKSVNEGRVRPAGEAFAALRRQIEADKQ
jgi:prevent-host-death family protein